METENFFNVQSLRLIANLFDPVSSTQFCTKEKCTLQTPTALSLTGPSGFLTPRRTTVSHRDKGLPLVFYTVRTWSQVRRKPHNFYTISYQKKIILDTYQKICMLKRKILSIDNTFLTANLY